MGHDAAADTSLAPLPGRARHTHSGIGCWCCRCGVMMLLCFANRLLGEPLLVSGGEVMVVVEASFELG